MGSSMEKRTEQEMLDLIRSVAEDLPAVRAVVLQGSRANPNVTPDEWQDFDIVFIVDQLDELLAAPEWIDRLGERLIMQTPESMELPPPTNEGTYAFLMLFTDGNRIDLTLMPLTIWNQRQPDSLSVPLLDKGEYLTKLPPPGESDYYLTPPSQKIFLDCCNEFWWTSTYLAKGLLREELIYAKSVQENVMRPMLGQMVRWRILMIHGPEVNPGKFGKYYQDLLPEGQWEQLLATYTTATLTAGWRALFRMADLFEQLAVMVASHFGFPYPAEEVRRVRAYLQQQAERSGIQF